MRLVFVFLISVFSSALLAAPAAGQDGEARHDSTLLAALEQATDGFRGEVGVYVRHLPSGRYAALRPDSLFPTASMIKVPILVKTFDLIEQGELDYGAKVPVASDSIDYPHSPYEFSARMTADEPVELNKLIWLMLTLSENNASLWLQDRVGGGEAINQWLADHGFQATRVNSRTEGRRPDWERYGWGQTTPREMAELLVMIHEGEAVSPAASEEMVRTLTRSFWDDEALAALPPTVQVASKQGAVSQSRSEVLLVHAPHGAYVLCVITKNQEDTSWTYDNEGFQLLRDISRLVWNHFEPDHPWTPAEGAEHYR